MRGKRIEETLVPPVRQPRFRPLHGLLATGPFREFLADRIKEDVMGSQELATSRFGSLRIEEEDILSFPSGMIGLETLREWVLFADAHNPTLGWLQSVDRADMALAVVSPRRYVPDYRVRVSRRELGPLQPNDSSDSHVLVVVSQNDHFVTLNLKAPIIVDLTRRLGRQVVTKDDQPLQHELPYRVSALKKSA